MIERAIERSMLGISLHEHNQGNSIEEQNKVLKGEVTQGQTCGKILKKQTTNGPLELLRGIQRTGNNHLKDVYNDRKMK